MEHSPILSDTGSKAFYRFVGGMAIFIVLAGLTDALTSMGTQAQDNRTIPIQQWFALFQASRFEAFSRMGLINLLTLSGCIPIYLAFLQAFRKQRPVLATLAALFFFTGTAVYLSSNSVFALFGLSQQYAAAPAAQKPVLEAAGRALLAQGADLTSGTFLGLFLTQVAGLLITSRLVQGAVFGKWAGRVGLVGFSLMSVFFILTAFVPGQYNTALLISVPGALFMMAYQVLLARKFFQLSR